MDLDLRKVRYFIAVAENLSFVQAAAELHMTQPALSRQVQTLERELGVRLFTRDRRGTALTGPGRQLLEDARPLLDASTALERRVRTAAKSARQFTIGFMPGVPSTALVREFTVTASGLQVDVVYVPHVEQEAFLLDGRVDVSFVRLPLRAPGLRTIPLFDEPRVAVVAISSPLAGATSLTLDDLRVVPLLDPPASVPGWGGDVLPLRRPLVTVEERIEAAASGAGFSVLPAGLARYHRHDGVATVPLDGVAPVVVALAHTRHRTMPEIERFADLCRSHLGAPVRTSGR